MPGANWTRKDYQAVAELIGKLAYIEDNPTDKELILHDWEFRKIVESAITSCRENAAMGSQGNGNYRNFQADSFRAECYKQARRAYDAGTI